MRRKMAKAAAFGPVARNAETGRGRALINVRRPDLERRGGDFEAQAHEHQRQRHADDHRRGRRVTASKRRADRAQIGRSGHAVDPPPRHKAKNAVAKDPSRKYFSAASLLRLSSRK